jgi:steroid delta-isomerase-like uncharacterized protein
MKELESKRIDSPDEVRKLVDKGKVDILRVGDRTVGRTHFEAGWKWSQHVKPLVGTDLCEQPHLGYCEAGKMRVVMKDGTTKEFGPGELFYIAPGHDAEILGNDEFVALDFLGSENYAKQAGADPKSLAKRFLLEVYGEGKVELLDELCADTFQTHDPLLGKLDRNGVREAVQTYRKAFPDLKFQIESVISEGDKVSTFWRASGTHKGSFLGQSATNKKASVEGVTVGRISGGKLVEDWTQYDVLSLFQQLGLSMDAGLAQAAE